MNGSKTIEAPAVELILFVDNEVNKVQYRNGGIGWNLNVKLPILQKCINAHSNQPYWGLSSPYRTDQDLRNPKLYERLQEIRRQVGIDT